MISRKRYAEKEQSQSMEKKSLASTAQRLEEH
jgi:hypothetical protein